jgi:Flp pilus assembly protein TadD
MLALLALLAALVLVAAGCGGSDEASSDETTVETTTETETTGEDMTETDTEDSDLSAFASEDCLQLASIGAKLSESLGATGSADPEATAAVFDELVSKAPDEIKDDLTVMANAMDEIATALKDVDLSSGTPDPEAIQKLQELGQTLDNAEIQQASDNLEAWATENCSTSG